MSAAAEAERAAGEKKNIEEKEGMAHTTEGTQRT